MNFRAKKLLQMCKEQGIKNVVSFLIKDLYYRILHRLAFPFWRSRVAQPNPKEFGVFLASLVKTNTASVLEIGSRDNSDVTVRGSFKPPIEYVGMDILAGPNVDVIGDAHELSSLFPKERFNGVFCISVFEHLLMPWKVVLEINTVLKTGGLVYVVTHPTWPPHELPWDFWRYQPNGFWALFNSSTGFELISCSTFEPSRLIPAGTGFHLGGTVKTECAMGVVALAKKIGPYDPRLAWPVKTADITSTSYPSKEINRVDARR